MGEEAEEVQVQPRISYTEGGGVVVEDEGEIRERETPDPGLGDDDDDNRKRDGRKRRLFRRYRVRRTPFRLPAGEEYKFKEAAADGGETGSEKTTVMIKTLPNKFTKEQLLELLDEHCRLENRNLQGGDSSISEYDFLYLPMDFRLEGKVAIITGAASGIGEASARLFASHGAIVVIADIQDELGIAVAASIGPDNCSYRHCDVADEKQVAETVDYTLTAYGRLDVMFSNAGIGGPFSGIMDVDVAGFDRTMAVNVRGAAAAIKHAARAMTARGTRGSIVCTASVASCGGGMGPAAYTASKHALVGLVQAAAGELGVHGIRVNCVSPFGVATPLTCGTLGKSPAELEEIVCAISNLKGVVLKASHIAEAALFLASGESEFISGQNLVVDGGSTVVQHDFQRFLD